MNIKPIPALLSLALYAILAWPASAQEILHKPEQPLKGKIGRTAADSTRAQGIQLAPRAE
jgi:hypothetical protein